MNEPVVDPNTLNLDPGRDPDPGLYYQFWKKKFKTIWEKNNFLFYKCIFCKNYKSKMSPKEISFKV